MSFALNSDPICFAAVPAEELEQEKSALSIEISSDSEEYSEAEVVSVSEDSDYEQSSGEDVDLDPSWEEKRPVDKRPSAKPPMTAEQVSDKRKQLLVDLRRMQVRSIPSF